MTRGDIWATVLHRRRVLEYFVLLNISFLAIDIYVAHSINEFAHWAEWIPFYFSVAAPIVLLAGRRGSATRSAPPALETHPPGSLPTQQGRFARPGGQSRGAVRALERPARRAV